MTRITLEDSVGCICGWEGLVSEAVKEDTIIVYGQTSMNSLICPGCETDQEENKSMYLEDG